jgi:hypothetical protein
MDESERAAWDRRIEMDKRSSSAYTIDVLQELMGEDAFREMYVRETEDFMSYGAHVHSVIEGTEYSFVVTHTLE